MADVLVINAPLKDGGLLAGAPTGGVVVGSAGRRSYDGIDIRV